MKKWILTIAIVLASVTGANAGWIQCDTIRILPGFLIQSCERTHRIDHRNRYLSHLDRRDHKHGYGPDIHARHRYDRHYYGGKRYLHPDRDIHGRPAPRYNSRW